ncbi:MAG: hypothetical protein CMJ83_22700 [Planctomycetes bacterium]|nr:hypothetical protein [Planctomycetota bacterium]
MDDSGDRRPDPQLPAPADSPAGQPVPGLTPSDRATPRGSRWGGAFVPQSASVRRRVLVVFLLVNLLNLGAVVFYVRHEGSMTEAILEDFARLRKREAAEARVIATRESLDPELRELLGRVESQLKSVIGLTINIDDRMDRLRLARAIWRMPLWQDPTLVHHVDRALIIHKSDQAATATYFNPPRGLIFEYEHLDREPSQMVENALVRDDVVLRGGKIAGALLIQGANWGGYYLRLRDDQRPRLAIDRSEESGSLLLIFLLLIPGMVFLFGFTWRLISQRVLEPVEELGRVARSVSRGDYSRRLEIPHHRDEVARVMIVFNRMLALVEEYRDEMEDKVQDAAEEIRRKNKELMLGQRLAATGTLAAGIAHEINNPLGGMLNVAKRLKRTDLSDEQRARYLQILEEGVERIGAIVRKVLAVSPRKVTPAPLDIGESVERAIDLVQHRAGQRGAVIELVKPTGPLPPVLGESNEVGQIFLNLLINAVDACEDGRGRVQVRLREVGESVTVEIEDDGVGMETEVAERAFDMFFTTKEAGAGTGLGLGTVHSLVEAHQGSLDLRTSPGKGTCFTVRLPVMQRGEDG